MKVLIVEDEFNSRRLIRKLLEDEFEDMVFLEASSVEEGIVLINEEKPELILCDIQLRNEKSFEIFLNVENQGFELIFITAHSEFALKAFDLGAAQYILKPVNRTKLYAAVEECIKRIKLREVNDNVKPAAATELTALNKIMVPGNQTSKIMHVEDIIFCKADGVYCKLYLEGGKEELLVKPLGFIEDKLSNHPHFFRPHKSFLINLNKVTAISGDKSMLTLKNNQVVPVGRSKKGELQELLKNTFL
ncbi:MAG: LytR/AlgR family response regulator transcription factor [Crocinitomicaceae bacterium]